MKYEDSNHGARAAYQASVGRMVADHVHTNVSMLVSECYEAFAQCGAFDGETADALMELFSPPERYGAQLDEEIPVLDAGQLYAALDALNEAGDLDDDGEPVEPVEDMRRDLVDLVADDEDAARDVCDALDIEPHQPEPLEHWLVDGDLARRLADHGETVAEPWPWFHVWARCTSGQAIALDGVACRIHDAWPAYCDEDED